MAELAPSLLGELVDRAAGAVAVALARAAAERQLESELRDVDEGKIFQMYVEAALSRTQIVKTLVNREVPVRLSDVYVRCLLTSGQRQFSESQCLSAILDPSNAVIVASAGTGKTMLMRSLFRYLLEEQDDRIPIFFELRTLDLGRWKEEEIALPNLALEAIYQHIKEYAALSRVAFEHCLQAGIFVFLLDGLDEVDFRIRSKLAQSIHQLSHRYPANSVVVSTRPDERLASWNNFRSYRVEPFSKHQIVELLERLPCDVGPKARFLKRLREGGLRRAQRVS